MGIARRTLMIALALAGVALALIAAGSRWAETRAAGEADRAAATIAASHVGLLASELQKFRLLPLVLAEYPDVAAALAGDGVGDRLDRTLELLARRTDAAVIYAIDRSGRTVAASNWRQPASFVGRNYGFRPYFNDAMRSGSAELFALGMVSGRPGLYLARRVDRRGTALGVIVVKVEFDAVEANWARSAGVTIATDAHGVVLVTSTPGWRFHATRALDAATVADARRTLQFGAAPPPAAPATIVGRDATGTDDGRAIRYRVARVPSPLAGGQVIHLAPLDPALAAARLQALLWGAALLILGGIVGGVMLHAADTRRIQRAARAALESEVAARTAELRIESAERLAADRRYRAAREELAQANRLGSIGQITAGVAHEINQPVAAIRTFAENAAILLDRGETEPTRANLGQIVALTERIGAITGELRAFARRRHGMRVPVAIGDVVDGLLLLVGERSRGRLTIAIPATVRAACVLGGRIRLEQVLVNLVQNALDAIEDRAEPQVTLSAHLVGQGVAITVADNGTGIDPALRDTLFTPFATGKAGGLGLGLAIARDIAREFGGELEATDSAGGATFVLTLPLAP